MTHPTLNETWDMVLRNHDGQLRKDGKTPYAKHPHEVWKVSVYLDASEECQHIALMHDLLEDTDITEDHLRRQNYSDHIIDSVKLLTKKDGQTYAEYIDGIITSGNLDAVQVKMWDIVHNLSESDDLAEDERWMIDRWFKALVALENAFEKLSSAKTSE